MEKNFHALGLMSGTSGDGVDSSVISSNGKDNVIIKYDRFDAYPTSLSTKIHKLKDSITEKRDLLKLSIEILCLSSGFRTLPDHKTLSIIIMPSSLINSLDFL